MEVSRGELYDARVAAIAATGAAMHGEADLVESLGATSVLDAGCGTGRVAIELARRGLKVCGVDRDPSMLAQARVKAPDLRWVEADLADPGLDLKETFDVVVAAGNVMIFVTRGTEPAAVATCARHLVPGGALVAGFQLCPDGLTVAAYDQAAVAAGLVRSDRWSTWDRAVWNGEAEYAVSVHRRRP